ncbi:MAG: hypothetical protein D6722_17460, partial [Bacteroidetes bacterium]
MRHFLPFLWFWLLLPVGGWGQPSEHWDVTFYDLEVQVHAGNQRVAGTQRLDFLVHRPIATIYLGLGQGLQVARLQLDGVPVTYEREGDSLKVNFGRRLPAGQRYQLEIVYGGAPPIPAGMDAAIWGRGPRGDDLVALEPAYLPGHHWWPSKADPQDLADSMRVAVICRQGPEVVIPGALLGREPRPGGFVRWAFSLPRPVGPEGLSLHIGPYVRLHTPMPEGPAMTLWALRGHEGPARQLQLQLQRLLPDLESYWGAAPMAQQPLRWVET